MSQLLRGIKFPVDDLRRRMRMISGFSEAHLT